MVHLIIYFIFICLNFPQFLFFFFFGESKVIDFFFYSAADIFGGLVYVRPEIACSISSKDEL